MHRQGLTIGAFFMTQHTSMDATQQGHVTTNITDGLATIEFYHPLSNSLPGRLLAQLAEAIRTCGADDNVAVILLKSAGDRAFCAGASFDELIAIEDFDTGKRFFMGFAHVINACRTCPKLIIGRVQGKAVGGGVGMASAVDYCFATEHASVKLSELAVGIGPFVVGPAVARKIGTSAMSQLAVNATAWQTAAWAEQKGLYASVHATAVEMDSAIDALIAKLKGSNPEAMAGLKSIFWQGTENWDTLLESRAAMSGQMVLSDFSKNAIAAFKKK